MCGGIRPSVGAICRVNSILVSIYLLEVHTHRVKELVGSGSRGQDSDRS